MREPLARSCLAMFDAPCTIRPAENLQVEGKSVRGNVSNILGLVDNSPPVNASKTHIKIHFSMCVFF